MNKSEPPAILEVELRYEHQISIKIVPCWAPSSINLSNTFTGLLVTANIFYIQVAPFIYPTEPLKVKLIRWLSKVLASNRDVSPFPISTSTSEEHHHTRGKEDDKTRLSSRQLASSPTPPLSCIDRVDFAVILPRGTS